MKTTGTSGEATTAEKELFAAAADAYVFGYPLVTMELTRRVFTNVVSPAENRAPMGQFVKERSHPPASDHTVTAPNADTLYTFAWFDVSAEPWVVSFPDMGDRYYLLPMLDGWTTVFANPGARTRGSGAQTYAITGPSWKGRLPEGLKELKSATSMVWLLGRIHSTGTPEDRKEVHALQDQFTATPLSSYGKPYTPPKGTVDPAVDDQTAVRDQVDAMDTEKYFQLLVSLLEKNPPTAKDGPMLARLKVLGIEPGKRFDSSKLTGALRAVPKAGQGRILEWLRKDAVAADIFTLKNGWLYTTAAGVYGTSYMQRAAITAIGLGANRPEDAIYPTSAIDGEGKPYLGANKYVMHFPKGQLPPAKAFWSLTMYTEQMFLVDNPINRYSISSRDSLQTGSDGSVDIYIQNASPGAELESNWLPAPPERFSLMLRMYWPSPEDEPPSILDGSWEPPPVTRTAVH